MIDDRLRLLVERIERLLEERRGISDDIRDVYAEVRAVGYDSHAVRQVIKRRRMKPDDRREADLLLETYECALAGGEPVEVVQPDARVAELAHALLAEQVAGIEDPRRAALLVEHVTVLLDLRAEIALLRQQEVARRKLAAADGFVAKQVRQAVRWIEKCIKHGAENMRAGEATFLLYRGTMDAARARTLESGPVTEDAKLAAAFAPAKPVKVSAATKRAAEAMAWAAGGR